MSAAGAMVMVVGIVFQFYPRSTPRVTPNSLATVNPPFNSIQDQLERDPILRTLLVASFQFYPRSTIDITKEMRPH